jgi:hypothetical protein
MNTKLLNERSIVLYEILKSTVDKYFDSKLNSGQRGLYETSIGAAIWYLPSGITLYTGKISKSAYQSIKRNDSDIKLVEEHFFPRKLGGRYLYELFKANKVLDVPSLVEIYTTVLGRFNLVLKSENNKLKKWQKVENFNGFSILDFTDTSKIEEYSYGNAGIELVDFSVNDYAAFKKYRSKRSK